MFRKTLTILSLIGLLLSAGAWGASYFHVMYYTQHEFLFSLSPGALQLGDFEKVRKWRDLPKWKPGLTIHGWLGGSATYWYFPRIQINSRVTNVILPFWIPILVFGPSLAFMYLPVRRRRKRKKLGLCVKCGYDLRASKDRCPECGETK